MTAASYSEAGLHKGGGFQSIAGLFIPAGGGLWGAEGRSAREGALQAFVLLFFGRKQ